MKMREEKHPWIPLMVLSLLLLWRAPAAMADVSPGDVIDQTNWQKAEGLVPEPLLDWIKKGDAIRVGALDYDPGEFLPPACRKSLTANVGKYDIDEDGVLADAKTGKLPRFVEGLPFPQIDVNDPKAGWKIMYNKTYYTYTVGNVYSPFQSQWIGRKTGVERGMSMDYWVYVLDGYPPAKEKRNPNNIEIYSLIRVLAPFDIKGTNILLWRYRSKKQDSTFAYVPAIRRVRRMSPANRSDAFLGSDFCVDDAWGYGGKVNNFEWKILRKEEQLIPFYPGNPGGLIENEEGEWETVNGDRKVTYGHQDEGYQGAPWFPTNLIYVKRPTYILECKAKDPYYNYGTQYMWVDAEFYQPSYKVIHDRSGAYWKVEWQSMIGGESADKNLRIMGLANMMAFDDRSEHATVLILSDPVNTGKFYMIQDANDYSLAGFQKFCK